MGVGWRAVFVPDNQNFLPPPGTGKRLLKELTPLGFHVTELEAPDSDPSPETTAARVDVLHTPEFDNANGRLSPRNPETTIAAVRFPDETIYLAYEFFVEEYREPHTAMDPYAEPSPEGVYTAALAFGIAVDGGPDLATESVPAIEQALREFLDGRVERWQTELGVRFHLVTMVV